MIKWFYRFTVMGVGFIAAAIMLYWIFSAAMVMILLHLAHNAPK